MYCHKCGKALECDADFCGFCGIEVKKDYKKDLPQSTQNRSEEEYKTTSDGNDKTAQRTSLKKVLALISVFVVIIIIAAMSIPAISNSYEEPIDSFMEALSNDNLEAFDRIIAPDCMGDIVNSLNLLRAMAAGYNWEFSITDAIRMDQYDLARLADIYFYEYSDLNLTNGYVVTGSAIGYNPNDASTPMYADTWEFTVAKVNGLQYVIALQCSERFSDYGE